MTDPRPREYAAEMLKDLREWWKQYQERIPQEYRAMTTAHVVSEMAKSVHRRKK